MYNYTIIKLYSSVTFIAYITACLSEWSMLSRANNSNILGIFGLFKLGLNNASLNVAILEMGGIKKNGRGNSH